MINDPADIVLDAMRLVYRRCQGVSLSEWAMTGVSQRYSETGAYQPTVF
jgi:hypothetical protein